MKFSYTYNNQNDDDYDDDYDDDGWNDNNDDFKNTRTTIDI